MKSSLWRYFSFFVFTFALIAVLSLNGKNWDTLDLRVYYEAGQHFWEKSRLYQLKEAGHYVYKYSPLFASVVAPFSLLPFYVFQVLYLLLLSLICAYLFVNLQAYFRLSFRHGAFLAFIMCCIFIRHIQKEIFLGQVNILLLFLIAMSSMKMQDKGYNDIIFGTISLFVKPIWLWIIPRFIYKRKRFLTLIGVIGICFFLPFIIHPDLGYHISNYLLWIEELSIEIRNETLLSNVNNQVLPAAIYRVFTLDALVSQNIAGFIVLSISLFIYRGYKSKSILLISSLTPLMICTSNNFYILSLPLFYFVLSKWNSFNRICKISIVIASTLMFISQYELFGSHGVQRIEYFAPYPWSVLIVAICLLKLEYRPHNLSSRHE